MDLTLRPPEELPEDPDLQNMVVNAGRCKALLADLVTTMAENSVSMSRMVALYTELAAVVPVLADPEAVAHFEGTEQEAADATLAIEAALVAMETYLPAHEDAQGNRWLEFVGLSGGQQQVRYLHPTLTTEIRAALQGVLALI